MKPNNCIVCRFSQDDVINTLEDLPFDMLCDLCDVDTLSDDMTAEDANINE